MYSQFIFTPIHSSFTEVFDGHPLHAISMNLSHETAPRGATDPRAPVTLPTPIEKRSSRSMEEMLPFQVNPFSFFI